MTKRLQAALFGEEEYREIRGGSPSQGMTVEEWVRQALRTARKDNPGSIDAKLRAIVDASRHEFPTADIKVMLCEIEAGRHLT